MAPFRASAPARNPKIRLNRLARCALVVALFACTSAAKATETCGVRLSTYRSGFEAGEQPQEAILPAANTALSLAVTYPPDGHVSGVRNIQVYGTLSGPPNTGVIVNNQIALSNASQFTSQPIALTEGANVLTVVASTQDGGTQTITRTIQYQPGSGNPVQFGAVSAGNFAPLRIPFSLNFNPPGANPNLARVQIDYDGNGQFDSDTTALPNSLFRDFATPGVYLARARVSFDDGNSGTPIEVHEAEFQIQMQQIAYTREVLCTVYYDMKHRLQATDITGALHTIATDKRNDYQAIWTSAGGNLPTIAASLGDIVKGQISDNSAELMAAVPDDQRPGDFLGFTVALERDPLGVWRISGL